MSDLETNLVELLTGHGQAKPEDPLHELCTTISNIVHSYDDPYDAFAELVQNALDAVAAKYENLNQDYIPKVALEVDVPGQTLLVKDNGTGIAWGQRKWAVKPNYSLKRRLGQRNSRGEKGAALAFLQFGHSEFKLSTQTMEDAWIYSLHNGKSWFNETSRLLDDGREFSEKASEFPPAQFELERIDRDNSIDTGTSASVGFSDGRLSELLGDDPVVAKKRLDYILLTRTGIGFYVHEGDREKLAPWQQSLQVSINLIMASGSKSWDLEPGFLYPHMLAKKDGSRKSNLLTSNVKNNELLYDFFDEDWIKKYLDRTGKSKAHLAVIRRFKLRGYVSYAHQNSWYEDVSASLLELPSDADSSALSEGLIQVNGGFLVAVKDFPTGRRKSFLHRSGAEHKSRTFVLLSFSGDYKPDYGRKNLAAEAHTLVLELCKELIAFATGKREFLYRGTQQSAHSAKNIADAEESLKEDAAKMRSRGYLIKSGNSELSRSPATETEVVAEYLRLVSTNVLPGFSIYGFLARGMLDGFFDYELHPSAEANFDVDKNPLGLAFAEGRPIKYRDQWMEFKVKSDALVDDFNKGSGEYGKKYFGLVHLLVCESIDTATDNFELVELNAENYDERRFFGVTHLLEYSGNKEHKVQVICLGSLRTIMGPYGSVASLRPVEPLES